MWSSAMLIPFRYWVALDRLNDGDVERGPSIHWRPAGSTHLLGRLDAENTEPRRENRDNALHQRKASHG